MNDLRLHDLTRRTLLRGLALATVTGGGGLLGLIRAAIAAGDKPVPKGLHRAVGDVRIDNRPAKPGAGIRAGAVVTTGAASTAIFVIGADAFLQRENSRIALGANPADEFLRVVSGKLLSVFSSGHRKLVTDTVVIGIRGTGCYIEAERERVYFCLCYGEAEVVPTADPGQREVVRTLHHDKPLYIHALAGDECKVSAPVINHTDAELTMLEALVGRVPPFGKKPDGANRYYRRSY